MTGYVHPLFLLAASAQYTVSGVRLSAKPGGVFQQPAPSILIQYKDRTVPPSYYDLDQSNPLPFVMEECIGCGVETSPADVCSSTHRLDRWSALYSLEHVSPFFGRNTGDGTLVTYAPLHTSRYLDDRNSNGQ
jgi:hypothetical protein